MSKFECNIQQLPAEWNDLHDLEELDLSQNKNLQTFSCTGLTKLKKLNLSWCNIQQLPAEWNDLHDLEELDLVTKKLNLSWCNIQQLPEELNLSWNENLETFSCTGLTKLKKLNFCWCNIQQLPAEWNDLHDLEELNLSGNKNLQPFSCTGLTKLKKLDLSECNIQQLPAELNDLHDLEELYLSEIKLEVFPTFSCLQWKHLRTLNLSGNKRLLCLPNNIWNGLNLWRLDLSNCGIESVPNTGK